MRKLESYVVTAVKRLCELENVEMAQPSITHEQFAETVSNFLHENVPDLQHFSITIYKSTFFRVVPVLHKTDDVMCFWPSTVLYI